MTWAATLAGTNARPGVIQYDINLDGGDDGESAAFDLSMCDAVSIQADGTWDSGDAAVQCSNDGVTYADLPTDVAFTADGVKTIPADGLGFKFYQIAVLLNGATFDVDFVVIGTLKGKARA